MRVAVINSGSSSIKYGVFDAGDCTSVAHGLLERIGTPQCTLRHRRVNEAGTWEETIETRSVADHREGLQWVLDVAAHSDSTRNLLGVGHRVVHGGEVFHEPVVIDDKVVGQIKELIPLAPLHNPANVIAIEVLRTILPGIPNVAVFDTSFHQTMPPRAFHYALPYELYRMHNVRRYGFHGSSHQYVAREASHYLGIPPERLNLITLHLGNGASATAIQGGSSIDTSMGLTPLEGLIMGTRCGDLDPAIHFYLSRKTGRPFGEIEGVLNRESGLKGICGENDMREIQRRAEEGDARAELAISMFCYRIRKYIGAYYAVLGRLDALVFTGGIGEHSARVRRESCEGLSALGIVLDNGRNREVSSGIVEIQGEDSRVKVLVIPTDEEREIARQTIRTIHRVRAGG